MVSKVAIVVLLLVTAVLASVSQFGDVPIRHKIKHKQRRGHRLRNSHKQATRLMVGLSSDTTRQNVGNGGNFGAWPAVVEVAHKALITSNATCGENGGEDYCKIIDARPHKSRVPQSQCGVCDINSSDTEKRHLIEYAVDGTPKWWQSPSLHQGMHFEYVTITVDLGQIYQVIHMLLRASNSPRPATWILEKSLDGELFTPWQYFATSEDDCLHRYGIPAQNTGYEFKDDSEVICSTEFSKPTPLENGEVQISLISGRPGANSSSLELLDFTLARYVRMRFQGMYMSQPGMKWLVTDADLLKRSFYSLRHIVIFGRCVCNGHAAKCKINDNDTEAYPKCECLHNTCGDHCERCCPMFNQRLYRQGSVGNENRCEKCQCNGHASECRYNADIDERGLSINTKGKFSGGGVCVNCTHFTTGINCEKCLPGYYRPFEVPPNAPEPCLPCDCYEHGVEGHCMSEGGECMCKEGFTGVRCDQCAPGYRGASCSKCGCDGRGTMPGGECESHCQCKLYVEGEVCDKCMLGYFGLSASNPEGCTKCFCSGVGSVCESWKNEKFTLFESYENWTVTDISTSLSAQPVTDLSTGFLVFSNYELEIDAIFWSAPEAYLGNKLLSYGSSFVFKVDWVVVRGDTSGKPTSGPNLIFIGKNGMKIASGDQFFSGTNATIDVRLVEDGWYHLPKTLFNIVSTRQRRTEYKGDPVTRVQFMSVLTDLQAVLLRGTFHTDQAECVLLKSILYVGGTSADTGEGLSLVEECKCPEGYSGSSCESCSFGYVRVYENSTSHETISRCVACNCNGHAETCDLVTGACGQCHHNTDGDSCQRCRDGYYGNAGRGTEHDCKRCACPLTITGNNFSPTCQLSDSTDANHVDKNWSGTAEQQYVCTACPEGYQGIHCESCIDGYYGTPTELGSECLACPCNGGPCDPVTGKCITCEGNTEGWRCERCKPGYWGDPSEGCVECECYELGATDNFCDVKTGHCKCRERYSGAQCQKCDLGFANLSADCAPCECHGNGSVSHVCDPDTGLCECKTGVLGGKCGSCREEFFNLTDSGCEGCNCHIHGSIDRNCNHVSGQCNCHPHTTGRRCDKCEFGYWSIDSRKGCEPCTCNPVGSVDEDCNDFTGQCQCRVGVEGLHCDHCAPYYFGFSASGCKPCEKCESEAFVCDPDTGKCVCPPLSHGPDCRTCVSNAWGWELRKGCRSCQCDRVGSIGQTCSNSTGQCECKEGFTGLKCGQCASGFYGFPECKRCDCDPRGVKEGRMDCDDFGQCLCKDLVTGRRCNRCRQATFALSEFNQLGCSRCFCFGRSQECSESSLTWGQLKLLMPRSLSVEYLDAYESGREEFEYVIVMKLEGSKAHREDAEIRFINGLQVVPSFTGNVSIGSYQTFTEPLYVQLPKLFLGDQTRSYGGFLNFSIEAQGDQGPLPYEVLREFPLVQIHSHHHFIINYFGPEILDTSSDASFSVQIFEENWKYHHDGKPINRAILMTALENVKHVFIRLTASVGFTKAIISAVTMETALEIDGTHNNLATTVEECSCPPQYEGLSCQLPSDGYYRWRSKNDSDLLEDLVGHVLPCSCNGRSDLCDKETGFCLNCRENTGGGSCESCAEGFYGDPNYESCQACPCPEARKNFARGCSVHGSSVQCICKHGYTGRLCEQCIQGYFGNPEDEDGSCQSCECNQDGITDFGCDSRSGQCYCKAGVTGRRCDKCQIPRTFLQDGACRLCDNCTMMLMDTIDEIRIAFEDATQELDFHGIPAPWLKLNEIGNATELWKDKFVFFDDARYRIENFDEKQIEKLSSKSQNVKNKSDKLQIKSKKLLNRSERLKEASDSLKSDVQDISKQISATIHQLNSYGNNEQHVQLPAALDEATKIRDHLRNTHESLDPFNSSALQCADKHHSVWTNISGLVESQNDKLQRLKSNMSDFERKINDIQTKAFHIFDTSDELHGFFTNGSAEVSTISQKHKTIEEMLSDVREIFSDSLNADSDVFLRMFEDNLRKIDKDVQLIGSWRNDLDDMLVENSDLLKDAQTFDLPRAKDHANVLERRAKQYEGLYEDTKRRASDAMRAIQAYGNITESIETARVLASEALEAAQMANAEIYPENGDSIADRGVVSLEESKKVHKLITHEIGRVNDLFSSLDTQMHKVSDLNNTIWQCAVKEGQISSMLNTYLSEASSNKDMLEAIEVSTKVSHEMREIRKNANIDNNKYPLKKKISILDRDWETKFSKAEENITISQRNIKAANSTLLDIEMAARDQNLTFTHWSEEFSKKIQALRDKIAIARHAAENIHISVDSGKSPCIRSYSPTLVSPTTSNNISVLFALKPKSNHSSLLFIKGESSKFIALEIVDRRVRFLWNLGNETAVITHPEKLKPQNPKNENAWYRVDAGRVMNVGSLSLRQMTNAGVFSAPSITTGASPAEFSRLTYDSTSRIWVGGVDEDFRPDKLEAPNKLSVVLHQLLVDGKDIGLWRFNTSEGDCKGAIAGPQESSGRDNSRHFNGLGYAVLQSKVRSPKNYYFDVRMTFKTLDENALLFFAMDPQTNGSVTLSLSGGKVMFRVDYENDTWLELNGTEPVNNGRWILVNFARAYSGEVEEGQLDVNGAITTSSPNRPVESAKVPNFNNVDYHIGGVPPGFNTKLIRGSTDHLLGCIKDIQIGTEALDPLESKHSYGVESSCSQTITKVGFYGDGYLELPSHSLRRPANFGFVFRTTKSNALLLLGAHSQEVLDETDSRNLVGNFSVNLIDGKINFKVDGGREVLLLTSNLTLNNGEFHVVSVSRANRRFELRIDDELQSYKGFKQATEVIQLPESRGGLYVGGAPRNPEFVNLAPLDPFEGTIKDLVFNNRSVTFENPIGFEKVRFGRDGPDKDLHDRMVMDGEPSRRVPKAEGCNRVGSYSYEPNGFKFGDGANSHSEVRIPSRNLWQRNFNIHFDFRTFYPNGIFFVAPGSKEKQKHHIILFLRDGNVHIIARGRKKQSTSVPVRVNDGHWHRVHLTSVGRRLLLSVTMQRGAVPVNSTEIRLPKRLNASNKIFVGGLPEEGVTLPGDIASKLEGFKGCIKRFSVNNNTQDLAKQNSHVNVGQCFPRVEKGSYFPGDAYAVFKRNFNVGKILELQLKFKTSELNGILLSVSDRDNFPAMSLEMFNGNIVLSCDLGDGIPFRAIKSLESKYAFCDNRWHTVDAFYDSEQIFVKVDNFTSVQNVAPHRNGRLLTKSPLYIGGLPETAPQGTLLSRENFKGCINNVVIRNEIRDWTDFDHLHNILLNECPAT